MKRKYGILILFCAAMLLLSACGSQTGLMDIKPGMTRTEIESKMGQPVYTHVYTQVYECHYPLTFNGTKGRVFITYESKDPSAPIRSYWEQGNTCRIGIEWYAEPYPEADDLDAKIDRDMEKLREYLQKTYGDRYTDLYEVTCTYNSDGACAGIRFLY